MAGAGGGGVGGAGSHAGAGGGVLRALPRVLLAFCTLILAFLAGFMLGANGPEVHLLPAPYEEMAQRALGVSVGGDAGSTRGADVAAAGATRGAGVKCDLSHVLHGAPPPPPVSASKKAMGAASGKTTTSGDGRFLMPSATIGEDRNLRWKGGSSLSAGESAASALMGGMNRVMHTDAGTQEEQRKNETCRDIGASMARFASPTSCGTSVSRSSRRAWRQEARAVGALPADTGLETPADVRKRALVRVNKNPPPTGKHRFSMQGHVNAAEFFDSFQGHLPPAEGLAKDALVLTHMENKRSNMTIEELSQECSKLDVVVLPDDPNTCLFLMEAGQDVSSFHALRSVRQKGARDSKEKWVLEGADTASQWWKQMPIPSVEDMEAHLSLLQLYVKNANSLESTTRNALNIPQRGGKARNMGPFYATFVSFRELPLFQNFYKRSRNTHLKDKPLVIFTTSAAKRHLPSDPGVTVVTHSVLDELAATVEQRVKAKQSIASQQLVHHQFAKLVAMHSLAMADVGFLWTDPGVEWLQDPMPYLRGMPGDIHLLMMHREDPIPRLSPFMVTSSFFFLRPSERSQNVLQEVLMSFDMAIALGDVDYVFSHRIAETMARYDSSALELSPRLFVSATATSVDSIAALLALTQTEHGQQSTVSGRAAAAAERLRHDMLRPIVVGASAFSYNSVQDCADSLNAWGVWGSS